jgi:C4-dicarboxylate-binding protein DctP
MAMAFARFLFGFALGVTASITSIQADPARLRFTLQTSIENPLGVNIAAFRDGVAKASGGAVAIEIFDKAQLYVDAKVPDAVSSGAIEMGLAQIGLYADAVPAVGIFQQPFIFDSDELTQAAASPDSEIRKLIDEQILAATGSRVLWWEPYGLNLAMSKGKPLVNPKDMEGRNVRALDAFGAEFITLCGGVPHVISGSKMLAALQAGTIDSAMTGVLNIRERELWRETQFINRIRHSAILFLVIINDKVWQRLTPPQQAIMQAEARKAEAEYWKAFTALEREAYQFSTAKGMMVKEMTSDDLAEWRLCSSGLVESFVEKLGDTAGRLMSAYARLRVELAEKPKPAAASSVRR